MKELKEKLLNDLKSLDIELDFELVLKKYSASYFGRYYPIKERIVLYVCENEEGDLYPYSTILTQCIHEVCHHMQWSDPLFTRSKGVMHNEDFYKKYQTLIQNYKQSSHSMC